MSIEELRAWAAQVCGYELQHGWILGPRGTRTNERWLPDQNISQAFEVLDAIYGLITKSESKPEYRWAAWTLERVPNNGHYRCRVEGARLWNHARTEHENRCMAILLASFAAHKALSEVKG